MKITKPKNLKVAYFLWFGSIFESCYENQTKSNKSYIKIILIFIVVINTKY